MSQLRVISLGAGVQSSAMALMATRGVIGPMPDHAIFADTGDEPADVYTHLEYLMRPGVLAFPVHIVRAWGGYGKASIKRRLSDEILASTRNESKGGSHARPPFFVSDPTTGKKGIIRRQCTGDFKIDPIQRKLREMLGLKFRQRWPKKILVEQWIGISTDEATRAKPATVRRKVNGEIVLLPHPSIVNRHPLLEQRVSRAGCLKWLEASGYPRPPKSACTFCPMHSDSEWRRIRADPEAWSKAIEVDRAIRTGLVSKGLRGALYLHPSLMALESVDLDTPKPSELQINLFEDECEGMCGV